MTRTIRRLPVSVKLAAFALIALVLGSASGDPSTGTIGAFLLVGVLLWGFIGSRDRGRARPKSRRSSPKPRTEPGFIWRWLNRPSPSIQGAIPHLASNAASLDEILALTPVQFEQFTLGVLRGLGYTDLRRTGGPGDLGVDIAGRDPLGRTTVVQCKRYAAHRKVGSPEVQKFIGMMNVEHRADHGLIVSTSRFTADATTLAERHGIVLVNGEALGRLLRDGNGAVRKQVERTWWRI
jgi:restriction endonuclease Mrr